MKRERICLTPAAGDYLTPQMDTVSLSSHKQDDGVLRLEFRCTSKSRPDHQLSIQVPLSKIEAAGLLRSLKMLQERGLIPFVPEATSTKN